MTRPAGPLIDNAPPGLSGAYRCTCGVSVRSGIYATSGLKVVVGAAAVPGGNLHPAIGVVHVVAPAPDVHRYRAHVCPPARQQAAMFALEPGDRDR